MSQNLWLDAYTARDALERKVKSLRDLVEEGRGAKDWRRAVGAFSGDEFTREVFAEGREIREAKQSRSRNGKTREAGPSFWSALTL